MVRSYEDEEALEQLRHHWGDAYSIMHGRDGWQAKRRDGRGGWIIRDSADDLFDAISRDYLKRPVPRDAGQSMSDIVRALVDAGYRVEFSKGPDGYVAVADDGSAGVHDAIAPTLAAALTTAADAAREHESPARD